MVGGVSVLVVLLACAIAIACWAVLVGVTRNNNDRLKRLLEIRELDKKLDALLKNAGIKYDPDEDVDADIQYAALNVGKILAIKLHREKTKMGLAESKKYVEELVRRSQSGKGNRP